MDEINMSEVPWITWYEWHLLVMGVATGLAVNVADRRGYHRLAAGGGLLAVISALQLWVTHGWQTHPWYFAAPVAVILASRDMSLPVYAVLDSTREFFHTLLVEIGLRARR